MGNHPEGPRENERVAPEKAVLSPREYFRDLALEASRAKESITLKAMLFDDSGAARAIAEVFKQAPKHVKKKLILDAYVSLVQKDSVEALSKKHSVFGHKISGAKREKYEFLIREFKKEGVDVEIINPPTNRTGHVVPWKGRDHIKAAVIDGGKKMYFGGVNFNRDDEYVDFMVKYEGHVAHELAKTLEGIQNGTITDNLVRQLDEHTKLLVDIGKPGESVIVPEVVDMVRGAQKSIVNISLFGPDGVFQKALRSQARGTAQKKPEQTEVLMSAQTLTKKFLGWGHVYDIVRKRRQQKLAQSGVSVLEVPEFVHGKLVIIDREDVAKGGAKAYFGAHNLDRGTVLAGMKEWGIITSDPVLIANLCAFYDKAKRNARTV